MNIQFTVRAQRRMEVVERWWREHRPESPNLFREELAEAQVRLASNPNSGTLHCRIRGKLLRRILLPKTRQWLYYRVETERQLVVIHTVWGAQRGSDPKAL